MHLSAKPKPLAQLSRAIPLSVSDIVQKLLMKDPNDRYQSAYGLTLDLKKSLENIDKKNFTFPLGLSDVSSYFRLSETLYGRTVELGRLRNVTFEAMQGSKSLVTLGGHSGSGKSRLVKELFEVLTEYEAIFSTTKYDFLHRNRPYFAFRNGFEGITNHLTSFTDERFHEARSQIIKILGDNSGLILEAVPSPPK